MLHHPIHEQGWGIGRQCVAPLVQARRSPKCSRVCPGEFGGQMSSNGDLGSDVFHGFFLVAPPLTASAVDCLSNGRQ